MNKNYVGKSFLIFFFFIFFYCKHRRRSKVKKEENIKKRNINFCVIFLFFLGITSLIPLLMISHPPCVSLLFFFVFFKGYKPHSHFSLFYSTTLLTLNFFFHATFHHTSLHKLIRATCFFFLCSSTPTPLTTHHHPLSLFSSMYW